MSSDPNRPSGPTSQVPTKPPGDSDSGPIGSERSTIHESAYDFWLFDLDGTIIDVDPGYIHSLFDRIGDRLGTEFTDREVSILWYGMGGSRERCLRDLDLEIDQFWSAFHTEEDPEARAAASYLHDDAEVLSTFTKPLGLVTHCQQYLTQPILDALDIRDWFDVVVCCSDITGWKPEPEPVGLAMADLGVPPGTRTGTLVGDDPYDTGAAWNTGLDSIHIERRDPMRRGQSVLADYRIRSLEAISTG